MKTLLFIIAAFFSSIVMQEKVAEIKSSSVLIKGKMSGITYEQDKAQFREMVNILKYDVYGYFGLKNQYDTDQKRKAYEESDDYRNKFAELGKLGSQLHASTYYIDFQPVYNASGSIPLKYEPVSKSLSVINEVDLNDFFDEPGYLQFDRVVLKPPKGLKVKEVNTSTVCLAFVDEIISFEISDPVLAARIEEEKDNLRLLFVFNITGVVPIRSVVSNEGPENYCLEAGLKKLILYNAVTNEVYTEYK